MLSRRLVARLALVSVLMLAALTPVRSQAPRKPLGKTEIEGIARLLMLEDTRQFDEAALAALLKSTHPEIRRRTVMAIAHIPSPGGRALLASVRKDPDAEVVATVVFATGQLKDPKDTESVTWLGQVLSSKDTPTATAREAARALGKIRAPESRATLARYLTEATSSAPPDVVGEALLSIGRFTTQEDIAPILRWVSTPDAEVRWRAAWALFRPRDPAAVPQLLKLCDDQSAEVRFWAVRGLAAAQVTAAKLDLATTSAKVRNLTRDPDRRVRTEALRVLVQYDDDASFDVVLAALDSLDTWLSVSAAEGLGRFQSRAAVAAPRLVAAAAISRPTSLRVTALNALVTLAPDAALGVASSLIRDSSLVARIAANQALQKLGPPGRERLDALEADPDTKKLIPPSGGNRGQRPPPAKRPESDYLRMVERWVVPDYEGAAQPRAILSTPRGDIELQLHAGDAPMGLDFFVSVVESGAIVGTEFGRVVPDFVAQQRAIRDDVTLRDEVNRLGLTRGNLSWASAGLDTGRPGYTLGSTPQPHNEGDFTSLGRVVSGMDVVDRLELTDRITGARMMK